MPISVSIEGADRRCQSGWLGDKRRRYIDVGKPRIRPMLVDRSTLSGIAATVKSTVKRGQ